MGPAGDRQAMATGAGRRAQRGQPGMRTGGRSFEPANRGSRVKRWLKIGAVTAVIGVAAFLGFEAVGGFDAVGNLFDGVSNSVPDIGGGDGIGGGDAPDLGGGDAPDLGGGGDLPGGGDVPGGGNTPGGGPSGGSPIGGAPGAGEGAVKVRP